MGRLFCPAGSPGERRPSSARLGSMEDGKAGGGKSGVGFDTGQEYSLFLALPLVLHPVLADSVERICLKDMTTGTLDGRVRALLVMSPSRREAWEEMLTLLDVAVNAVSRNSRAQEILVAEPPDFILTDEILTDADWRQMVEQALDRNPNSLIVVCARSAPDINFVSEALHWGAYDVIADPSNQTALGSLVRTATLRRGSARTAEPCGHGRITEVSA